MCAVPPLQEPVEINRRAYLSPAVDLDAARERLWCLPGKAIVVVPPYHEQEESGFVLPDVVTKKVRGRLPCGVVVAAHEDTGLRIGDDALIDGVLAKRVRNVQIGEFQVPESVGETWLFGVTSPMVSTSYPVRPERYVCATVHQSEALPQASTPPPPTQAMEPRYKATSRTMHLKNKKLDRPWVILKLPTKCEQMRGLYLPDHMKDRDDMAIVEAVSPNCQHVKPGHIVWYQRRALEGLYSAGPDFGALPEYAIFAIINA